jgi:hypothetical protein
MVLDSHHFIRKQANTLCGDMMAKEMDLRYCTQAILLVDDQAR